MQRAKQELRSRQGPPRKKRFVREETLVALMEHAIHEGNHNMAMLFLAGYAFMLRVPSELLPAVVGKDGDAERPLAIGAHSCMGVCGNEVVLRLSKRKNKVHGSVLRRQCWCATRTPYNVPRPRAWALAWTAAARVPTLLRCRSCVGAQGPQEATALRERQGG